MLIYIKHIYEDTCYDKQVPSGSIFFKFVSPYVYFHSTVQLIESIISIN